MLFLYSSFGSARCAECERDPTQAAFVFESVFALVDVVPRRARAYMARRHLFAHLVERHCDDAAAPHTHALVEYTLPLVSPLASRAPPLRVLAAMLDAVQGSVVARRVSSRDDLHAALETRAAALASSDSHVDWRVRVPTRPSALFNTDDIVATRRQFNVPRDLFPSLDRLFPKRHAN